MKCPLALWRDASLSASSSVKPIYTSAKTRARRELSGFSACNSALAVLVCCPPSTSYLYTSLRRSENCVFSWTSTHKTATGGTPGPEGSLAIFCLRFSRKWLSRDRISLVSFAGSIMLFTGRLYIPVTYSHRKWQILALRRANTYLIMKPTMNYSSKYHTTILSWVAKKYCQYTVQVTKAVQFSSSQYQWSI